MEQKNKIPLRQFYRNIDDYILNQAHDEAILYSKFLLEKYPKNITVYQLLGKSFLDKQQYDLAQLFFEKTLEIEPDDFVSHIGISLISESFGNLERALEKMQRAYEIQPSNESLQNEVIRLIRAKDGFAPEKLRLTRGALIKMYARSKLTEQAIAEARLGIHESPDRIDYKIQLAEMLFAEKKNEEAIEQCLAVLKTFPYCKPILTLLYRILSSSENSVDAESYRSRLTELDPYYAFMKPETTSVNDIPDVAIMIDAGGIPESKIEDLSKFIHDIWSGAAHLLPSEPRIVNDDWQSIVDDAIANNGIGAPFQGSTMQEVKPEDDTDLPASDVIKTGVSKRSKLLSRLSPTRGDEPDVNQEEIPDWILSYSKLESEELGLETNHPTSLEDDATAMEDIFAEDGMTDHFIPVNPALHNEDYASGANDWERIEDHKEDEVITSNKHSLEDTQKIKIVNQDPSVTSAQLDQALAENDSEFAISCIESLLSKEYQLQELADRMDTYLKEKPTDIEIWLSLVRVYRKLGYNDKALSALENAQMNISI